MRKVRRPDISTPIVTLSNYAAVVGAVVPVVVVVVVVGLNVRVVVEFVATDGQCFSWVLR